MFEITPEMQEWYQCLASDHARVYLRDAVAAWEWEKWKVNHRGLHVCTRFMCGPKSKWTWPQWQAEAHKRLMGEK